MRTHTHLAVTFAFSSIHIYSALTKRFNHVASVLCVCVCRTFPNKGSPAARDGADTEMDGYSYMVTHLKFISRKSSSFTVWKMRARINTILHIFIRIPDRFHVKCILYMFIALFWHVNEYYMRTQSALSHWSTIWFCADPVKHCQTFHV